MSSNPFHVIVGYGDKRQKGVVRGVAYRQRQRVLLPNYTALWQRHLSVNDFPRVSTRRPAAGSRTWYLLISCPAPNYCAIEPHFSVMQVTRRRWQRCHSFPTCSSTWWQCRRATFYSLIQVTRRRWQRCHSFPTCSSTWWQRRRATFYSLIQVTRRRWQRCHSFLTYSSTWWQRRRATFYSAIQVTRRRWQRCHSFPTCSSIWRQRRWLAVNSWTPATMTYRRRYSVNHQKDGFAWIRSPQPTCV